MNSLRLSLADRFFFLPVAALAVCLQPWWTFPMGYYNYSRWVEIGFLVLFAISVLVIRGRALSVLIRNRWLCMGLLALAVISCLRSRAGWLSWVAMERDLLWILVLVVLAALGEGTTPAGRRLLAQSFTVVLLFHLCYCLLGRLVLISQGVHSVEWAIAGFLNRNHAAGFYELSLLFMPACQRLGAGRERLTALPFVLAGGMLAFMLLNIGSRGAFLGIAVAALCVFLMTRGQPAQWYWRALKRYLIVGVVLLLTIKLLGWLFHPGAYNWRHLYFVSTGGRFVLWGVAWKGFLAAPWFGNGPLSYAMTHLWVVHPHNLILCLLYEYGLLFTALLAGVAVALSLRLLRRRQLMMSNPMVFASVGVMVAFLVHSQFSGLFMIPPTMLVFAMAFGFCASTLPHHGEGIAEPARSPAVTVGTGVVILVLALSAPVMTLNYWRVAPNRDQIGEKPRFWGNGQITRPIPAFWPPGW